MNALKIFTLAFLSLLILSINMNTVAASGVGGVQSSIGGATRMTSNGGSEVLTKAGNGGVLGSNVAKTADGFTKSTVIRPAGNEVFVIEKSAAKGGYGSISTQQVDSTTPPPPLPPEFVAPPPPFIPPPM